MNIQRRLFSTFKPSTFRVTFAPQIDIGRYTVSKEWDAKREERLAQEKEWRELKRQRLKEWKQRHGLVGPPPRVYYNPSLIDFRVGNINHCIKHPDADRLLVAAVSCGDDPMSPVVEMSTAEFKRLGIYDLLPTKETHRIVSIKLIHGFYTSEELIGHRCVLASNVGHTTFRGVQTAGIIAIAQRWAPGADRTVSPLAAELVLPPHEAKVGEQLVFEKYDKGHWLMKRNMKRWDMWTRCAEGITTNSEKEIVFDGSRIEDPGFRSESDEPVKLVRVGLGPEGGLCTAPTIENARIR